MANGKTGQPVPITADLAGARNPSNLIEPLLVDANGNLLVTGTITATNPSVSPNGSPIPLDSTLIGGENPSGNLQPVSTDASGNVNVNVISSALPNGGATSANQALEITQLNNIDTAVTALNTRTAGALVPLAFNEVDLTYITSGNGTGQIGTAVYKLASATVATLTLTYDASNRLSTVVKS